ncbi:MAG TPA: tRNA (adenosine(37)-N6)-dimethylallyltransferase MiaA [Desulfuromonadales bacterium]|nr:tRNA (adenosine(37)-N6)-dimethylallyltransferase MiaA [Desulfuromonadales bacterium]
MTPALLPKILVICGPTASGKSELALQLAREIDAEIVNADSMQVYRGLSVGTAKPSFEQLQSIPHHLIDIADPDQPFSAADFITAADTAIRDISIRSKKVIVAGGTGLYIRTLLKGLIDTPSDTEIRKILKEEADKFGSGAMLERLREIDPELAARLHPNNLVRIIRALEVYKLTGIPLSSYQHSHSFNERHYNALQIGMLTERSQLYQRIDMRVERMLREGLFDETRELLKMGFTPELKPLRSIGYKEAVAYLEGSISMEKAVELIKRNTRHYAKRQLTWFNAEPGILWLEYPEKFVTIRTTVIDFFDGQKE